MKVIGLHADEAMNQFSSTQHVNVWDTWMRGFYCEATMDSLPEEVIDDPESYFLEPTTEDGIPVTLEVALRVSHAR
jgi:hypothetical protein